MSSIRPSRLWLFAPFAGAAGTDRLGGCGGPSRSGRRPGRSASCGRDPGSGRSSPCARMADDAAQDLDRQPGHLVDGGDGARDDLRRPAVFALLKPSLAPFALFGASRRSWWIALAVLVAFSVPFGALWADWLAASRTRAAAACSTRPSRCRCCSCRSSPGSAGRGAGSGVAVAGGVTAAAPGRRLGSSRRLECRRHSSRPGRVAAIPGQICTRGLVGLVPAASHALGAPQLAVHG